MIRRIEGALYNTDTARTIGTWRAETASDAEDDKECIFKTLYVTRSGKYFVHSVGRAKTVYVHRSSSDASKKLWIDHEQIVPLDAWNAQKWAWEWLTAAECDRAFGIPDLSSDQRKVISCSIPVYQHDMLIRKRAEENTTISSLIEEALNEYMGIDPTQKGAP